MKEFKIPAACMADSYKAGHFMMMPGITSATAYGEFRKGYPGLEDQRIVFYGLRHIIETYLEHQWTIEEVEAAEKFYATHNAGFTPYPFPKGLFLKFVKENNGYFPVKVEALPEGTVIYLHTPIYQITAEGEYAVLCTFLETLMTQVWYPSTVATLSRHARTIISSFFDRTVDDENRWKLDSRLHDFGYRGCTCQEQAVLGGTSHLLNFTGSDTMPACYHAQFNLNGGKPVGSSIPATEHSVMTSFPDEITAVRHMLTMFGQNPLVNQLGILATVGDSYNYKDFLEKVVPVAAAEFKGKFGLWVIRPDSGNPVQCVLDGLKAAETVFGAMVNKKGFKVINNAAVIQGDGIDIKDMARILGKVEKAGYSVENVAFGMGGGLLQKINRDTLSMATKLSHITYAGTGESRDLLKKPATDGGKNSLPGVMKVVQEPENPVLKVYPAETDTTGMRNMLEVVYDRGPVSHNWPLFDDLKASILRQYETRPAIADPLSTQMHHKVAKYLGAGLSNA